MGGLGNTLFQFFFGRVLRSKGFEVSFIETLVKSNFITHTARWKIHAPLYKKFFDEALSDHNVFPVLLALVLKKAEMTHGKYLFYREFQDIKIIANNGHVFGYFQDPEIFLNNLDSFHLFCSEISEKLKINQSIDQVAHLRFGDRLNDKKWVDSNMIFHEKIRKIIKQSSKTTTIITDSVIHCRKFLGECNNLIFPDTGDAFEDFIKLCSAESLILSPSTFSWWAAHLNKQCKEVYMPSSLHSELGFYNENTKLQII